MNQNGKHRDVALVDVIEDDAQQTETSTFYDSNNPVLMPAKQIDIEKNKSWKRKLIGWCFVLLLIAGGAVALYLLLRVNRVNVRVQADSRRDAQNAKPKNDSNNSENGLTADAINIVRAATGTDTTTPNTANPTASPNTSLLPSPSLALNVGHNLSFTGNSSPVNEPFNDARSNGNASQQQNSNGTQQQGKTGDVSAAASAQSHTNVTQSLFVDDSPAKLSNQQQLVTSVQSRLEKKTASTAIVKTPPAVLPPFGTMLPVRTQGVIFTLRNNSYARLELTRDCSGAGWSLPKGTVLVGRTMGSESDRAFVNVISYIDPRDNKLVKMTGDVLGSDGAAGIPGKRIGVDRNRLKHTLRKVASSGVQVAGMMAGALTGRGTVVIDGAGYRLMNPITDEARGMIGAGTSNSFVKVEAGRAAYVMVADLPKSLQAVDAPGESELAQAAHSLTDREVMELILFGTPEEIRAATPLMSDEQKQLILKAIAPENEKR
jgi:hypothetical protein